MAIDRFDPNEKFLCMDYSVDGYYMRYDDLMAFFADSNAVHVGILRGDIKLTREQAIHIAGLPADVDKLLAELERKLAALQWRPITAEDLPKVGDEVYCEDKWSSLRIRIVSVTPCFMEDNGIEQLRAMGYTHFRPINPPASEVQG